MTVFKYVELFAGIGGFRAGLDKLGGECVLAAEWDKYAQKSYTALYGGEHLLGDVTKVDENEVPDHDVLVFGMPCQAFSVAGKRLGFEDMRGTLYFEALRIAKAKKPKVLLMENVKGLVGHDGGRTLDVMAQAMSDIGYTIDFNVLNSKYFGVPQNRERIFMVGVRDDLVSENPWNITGTNVVAKGKHRIAAYGGVKTFNFEWPEQAEVNVLLRDVLETEVNDKYYLSDEKTSKLVVQLEGRNDRESIIVDTRQHIDSRLGKGARIYVDICPALNATEYKEPKKVAEPIIYGNLNHYGNDQMNRVYDVNGVSPTITVVSGGGREQKIAEPNELRYRIRKLTPRECWRLQGFTDAQHQMAVDAGISDSQLYKQSGNAVTVNVITAIGENMLHFLS